MEKPKRRFSVASIQKRGREMWYH